jgi:hypothetical protein
VRSGEEDKDPNEHGLGSLPVLLAAQLTWITKLILCFSHLQEHRAITLMVNFLRTFHAVHLQCVVEGLKPVAAATKTLDQRIKENLKKKQYFHHSLS